MSDFQVKGMTCDHCEATVFRAVRAIDPEAEVTVERAANRVTVDSAVDPEAIQSAIEAEGYTVSRRA